MQEILGQVFYEGSTKDTVNILVGSDLFPGLNAYHLLVTYFAQTPALLASPSVWYFCVVCFVATSYIPGIQAYSNVAKWGDGGD